MSPSTATAGDASPPPILAFRSLPPARPVNVSYLAWPPAGRLQPARPSPPRPRPPASAACNDVSKLCGKGGCGALLVTKKYANEQGGDRKTCCAGLGERGAMRGASSPANATRAVCAWEGLPVLWFKRVQRLEPTSGV